MQSRGVYGTTRSGVTVAEPRGQGTIGSGGTIAKPWYWSSKFYLGFAPCL